MGYRRYAGLESCSLTLARWAADAEALSGRWQRLPSSGRGLGRYSFQCFAFMLAPSSHSSGRGFGPRRSRGTLQLSTRCSSLALPLSRSLAVRIGWTPLASPLARSVAPGAAKVASKISVHATTWAPAGNIIRGELAIGSFRFDCIGTLGLVGPDWRCLVRRAFGKLFLLIQRTAYRCAPRSVRVALRCLAGCLRGGLCHSTLFQFRNSRDS